LLQLSYLPCLTHRGGWRAQIEGVRVDSRRRGSGLGRMMIAHAVGLARSRNCAMVQLTTDKRRGDAIRFYESLGFKASHEGMKLSLR
jgi:ribosomal protein S18 acetylase RimI-like enzyme